MLVLAAAALLTACPPPPEGLRRTPAGNGPRIYIDWDAKPLPEIPFPNDLAARPDPHSPTGLRLNFSLDAVTHLEKEAREKLNDYTGFGINAPMFVRFEAPLDLADIAARHADDNDRSDDAFYVIDVTPESPTFGQAVDLDVGHGRFPTVVAEADRYFPNDFRLGAPSLLFESVDEDLNGNGELDPGEDSDGDGILDAPNTFPDGGDPRADLLEWYDRQTDTLMWRPVVPLRQRTTYAVVLTDRLKGVDGEPVRSPWEYVNHVRQTRKLQALTDILPDLGLSLEELAFAWTFTTADVTGDLVELRMGLDGEGPYAGFGDEFPPVFEGADPMHEDEDLPNFYELPADVLINTAVLLGAVPSEASGLLQTGYRYTDVIVGGRFSAPDLLYDRDDDGGDTTDEWWRLDRGAGWIDAQPRTLTFTCFLPKADADHQAPFPVAMWGHGYGSARFDMILFAWAANMAGYALCGFDFPYHGISVPPDELEQFRPALENGGLMPMFEHLMANRSRDVDNDGEPDSGADYYLSDPFHTRDNVRQSALDFMQFLRVLENCGNGSLGVDVNGDGEVEASCDWNGDGTPDLGGPDVSYGYVGISMGGIVGTVLAPVEPDLAVVMAHAGGGDLGGISVRTAFAGIPEAAMGPLLSPFFWGEPDGQGGLRIHQYVTTFDDSDSLFVGSVDALPAGGRVRLENLDLGEIREAWIPADGRFRVAIPANALDPAGKRALVGMPHSGPAADTVYEVADSEALGDRLRFTVLDAEGDEVLVLNTFTEEVNHLGLTLPAGSALVALGEGTGHIRGSADFRRLTQVVGMALEPSDPISYARHIGLEPFEELGGVPTNYLLQPTIGDDVVMIGGGIALARAAGLIDYTTEDPRYGMTVDRWLIERHVVLGLEEWGPYTDGNGAPMLFDPDDLDDGTDSFNAPSDDPLRASFETANGTVALRLPYVLPTGNHGITFPDETSPFDINTFSLNQMTRFLQVHGEHISDDHCLEGSDCDFFRPVPE